MHGSREFVVTRNKGRWDFLLQTYVGWTAVSSTYSAQISSGWTLPQFFMRGRYCSVFLEAVPFKTSPDFFSSSLAHPQPWILLSCSSLVLEPSSLAPSSWSPSHLDLKQKFSSNLHNNFVKIYSFCPSCGCRDRIRDLNLLLSFSDPSHRQLPNAL